jgi:homogentisate 1,2-dioxygenase
MFETRLPQQVTEFASKLEALDTAYQDCWADIGKQFDGKA